jgi:hypothetical protein
MILVTGGAGFIGANFVLDWLRQHHEPVLNLDKLTYAGNLENLASLKGDNGGRHIFVQGDIGDRALVARLLAEHRPRAIVNFAAESHVDRSIHGPEDFIQTNIVGTFHLLEEVRGYWMNLSDADKAAFRFLHVSTDEVYGSLGPDDAPFTEETPFAPNSPYSASKALRPPGARLPPHLRPAHADHQLLQQLRPLPVPGEADPPDDPQRHPGQAPAHLRRRHERARLALRHRPLFRHPRGAGARAAWARPTTSAAGTRCPTSKS